MCLNGGSWHYYGVEKTLEVPDCHFHAIRIPRPPGRIQVFRRVVTNPIWLGVTATTVTENTIVSAYLTFAAKYLQSQYRIPAHISSIHTGALLLLSVVACWWI